jgi:hypothetical protein
MSALDEPMIGPPIDPIREGIDRTTAWSLSREFAILGQVHSLAATFPFSIPNLSFWQAEDGVGMGYDAEVDANGQCLYFHYSRIDFERSPL